MESCWNVDPEKRPSFKQIRVSLTKFLRRSSPLYPIKPSHASDYEFMKPARRRTSSYPVEASAQTSHSPDYEIPVQFQIELPGIFSSIYESSSLKNESCPGFSLCQMKGLTKSTISI